MLCRFKNGTIKSLILTLKMFKRFFFSILFDMVLRTVMQKFCKVWRPMSKKFCTPWRILLQKFYTPWRPVLQEFCTPWRPALQKFCKIWRPQQQEFCKQWHPELKKCYVWQGSMLQKFWIVVFPFSKKTNCRGPTHTNSLAFLCFLYFSLILDEIISWCFFEWQDKLVKITPRLETGGPYPLS